MSEYIPKLQIQLTLLDFFDIASVQSRINQNIQKEIKANQSFQQRNQQKNYYFIPDRGFKYFDVHINYGDQRGGCNTPMVWRHDNLTIKLQREYIGEPVNNSYHIGYVIQPNFIGDEWDEHVFGNEHSASDVEREFWKPDEEFVNPTSENPVRIEDFLKYLDLTKIMATLEKLYVEDWEWSFTFPKGAMLKTLIYFKLKGYKFLTDLWKDMATSPTLADNLGFKEIPCYNTFYDFLINRLGSQGIKKIFDAFVEANRIELLKYDIELGKDIGIDASPIPAKKKDKEADWNGHYKMWCYMWHNLRCMDTNLPLEFHLTNGKEDEAHFLAPFIYRLNMMKNIHPNKIYIDCGYATRENIARLSVFWDILIKCNIAKNWKVLPELSFKELERRYSKLWKEEYYKTKPTADEILFTLIGTKESNFKTVGKHFRNDIISVYEECPDGYMDDYHLRNRIEGCHGSEKRNYNIKIIEAKGIERTTTHFGMHLISVLAISLCRLQNGVSEGLTDTAGLI